jgi:haloacetate dehalogenase
VTSSPGFAETRLDGADGVRLRVRVGGEGPPVVLLHGHPRRTPPGTGSPRCWPRPGSALLQGPAASLRAAGGRRVLSHAPYSKRAMAGDVVALMRGLGHERFAVVGHDRGSYVALRTALDHSGAVSRLAVLDCIPIVEHLDRADARFAAA